MAKNIVVHKNEKCEGGCDEHIGPLEMVKVTGNGWVTPWAFTYCQAAIETDRNHGFTVEIVEETKIILTT